MLTPTYRFFFKKVSSFTCKILFIETSDCINTRDESIVTLYFFEFISLKFSLLLLLLVFIREINILSLTSVFPEVSIFKVFFLFCSPLPEPTENKELV